MPHYFITATGTSIGKTLITAALSHQCIIQHRPVIALKPVVSGWDGLAGSDTALLLESLQLEPTPDAVDTLSPWRFSAPLSPDIAAAKEGRTIDFDALVTHCRLAEGLTDVLLIEGTGGALTPLTHRHTNLDWMAALGYPTILVCGSYLGTISHTLATVRAMESAGITIAAVIMSESETSAGLDDTIKTLKNFVTYPILPVPRLSGNKLFTHVPDLWNALV